MKYRITISTQTPEVSDAEISELRDFDQLLKQHAKAAVRRSAFVKIAAVVALLGLLVLAIVYSLYTGSGMNTVGTPDISKRSENTPRPNLSDTTEQDVSNTIDSRERNHGKPLSKGDSIYRDTPHIPMPAVQRYEKAMPVGGYDSLYQYFRKNLIYPQEHARDSIEGIVMVSFMIDRDGRVQNIRVQHNLNEGFAQEAVKLIANMPPWQPATMNELPVASTISIPIKFEVPRQ